jgi:membrane protease YdiL (CAAX protease family)
MDARRRLAPSGKTAIVFVVLALGFAWLYWLAVHLSRAGLLPFSMEHSGFFLASLPGTLLWCLFRGFGPAVAGVIAVALCRGRAGLAELWRSVSLWRVPGWLYFVGWFGLVPSLAVLVTGLAIGEMHFAPSMPVLRLLLFFFPMMILDGPLGEEVGWRGVLLPELLDRLHALWASLIVGVVWYLWHVPLYLADGRAMSSVDHLEFLGSCIALSILFTWFFIKSGGSTFLAVYLHNCTNYFIFLRFKTFSRLGVSNLPSVAHLLVLAFLAVLAAVSLRRSTETSRE